MKFDVICFCNFLTSLVEGVYLEDIHGDRTFDLISVSWSLLETRICVNFVFSYYSALLWLLLIQHLFGIIERA